MKRAFALAGAGLTAAAWLAGPLVAGEPLDPNVKLVEESIPAGAPSLWEVEVVAYGWLVNLDGSSGYQGIIADIDIGFDDVADNLDFAAAGSFAVSRGPYGFMFDGQYLKVSDDFEINGPLFRKADVTMWGGVGLFGATYRVVDSPSYQLTLVAGGQVTYSKVQIRLARNLAPRSLGDSESTAWLDGIGGVLGRWHMTDRWFLNYYGTIGAGSSDLTWQVGGALGYQFTEHVSARLGYRYMHTDYEKGDQDFVYDIDTQGIMLGLGITF